MVAFDAVDSANGMPVRAAARASRTSPSGHRAPFRPVGAMTRGIGCFRPKVDREVALADVQQPPGLEADRLERRAVAPEPPLALRATFQVIENHAGQPLCREPSVIL